MKFNEKAKNGSKDIHPLMEVENINLYLKGCWKLGVPSSDLFAVNDLHQKRGISSVVNNLISLSRIAHHSLGCSVKPIGPNVNPSKPRNQAKAWSVQTVKFVSTHDVTDDSNSVVTLLNEKLKTVESSRSEIEKELKASFDRNKDMEETIIKLERELMFLKDHKASTIKSEDKNTNNIQDKDSSSNQTALQLKLKDYEDENQSLKKKILTLTKEKNTAVSNLRAEKEETSRLNSANMDLKVENLRLKAELEVLGANNPQDCEQNDSNLTVLKTDSDKTKKYHNAKIDVHLKKIKREIEDEEEKLRSYDNNGEGLFFYEKKIDESLLYHTQSIINSILNVGDIEVEGYDILKNLFKYDTGRRLFIFILKQAFKRKKSRRVERNTYELLIFVFNLILTEMNRDSSKDFNTMKIIFAMSKRINYYDTYSETARYLKFDIRYHFIWQNLLFWEQLFMSNISKQFSYEYVDSSEKEQSSKEVLFLYRSLKRFGYMMLDWGLPLEITVFFVSITSNQVKLPEKRRLAIEAKLEKCSASLLKIERKTKEKEERKLMKKEKEDERLQGSN